MAKRGTALDAATEVLRAQGTHLHTGTRESLLAFATATKRDIWVWTLGHNTTTSGDPYDRAHSAARYWGKQWEAVVGCPLDSEEAVRAYGMVYYGGFKTAAGCMVRGWREYMQHRPKRWGGGYEPDDVPPHVYLRCPYRRSQHRGASKGGGTFGHIYANAWETGVRCAVQHLAEQRERV